MGKSDPVIFPWYASRMTSLAGKRIAFLSQTEHNFLSRSLSPAESYFYDISLGNWDMNQHQAWSIPEVDAIVCTRAACFSENPKDFIERCLSSVVPGGTVFIDWGLGDHWRHRKFMVGWVSGEERVSVTYDKVHYLRSAYWTSEFEAHPEVQKFSLWISEKGYDKSLTDIIKEEVPCVTCHPSLVAYDAITLWQDSPQLYVLTEFRHD